MKIFDTIEAIYLNIQNKSVKIHYFQKQKQNLLMVAADRNRIIEKRFADWKKMNK